MADNQELQKKLKENTQRIYLEACKEYNYIDKSELTRNKWRDYCSDSGQYEYVEPILKEYGSFTEMKRTILKNLGTTQDDPRLDDPIILPKKKKRNYIVTAAVAGQPAHEGFLKALRNYAEENAAELIILPVKAPTGKDAVYDPTIVEYSDYFSRSIEFNSNLCSKDFQLNPQQMIPLTGMGRFGQKGTSLIIPHTKMMMRVEPVSNVKYPHIVHSTGVVTLPETYRPTRAGAFARQDHKLAAVTIEIDGSKFHIRQLMWNEDKGWFFDLDKRYHTNKITKNEIAAFIMGDLHAGQHDPEALEKFLEIINLVKAKKLFLHDAFDGASINHHAEGDFIQLTQHKPDYARTLEGELWKFAEVINYIGKSIDSEMIMVPSNHPEWVERYLRYGKYTEKGEEQNHILALKLALAYIEQRRNPIEYWYNEIAPANIEDPRNRKLHQEIAKRILWLKRGDDFFIGGRQLAAHGDRGHSGSKGSITSLEQAYGSAITGHIHYPSILREMITVGTTTPRQVPYTEGDPTKWLNSSVIMDNDGMYQIVNLIDYEYRAAV